MNWFSSTPRLPSPCGDYNVGYVDIMTDGKPEVSCYFRLYFPTDQSPDRSTGKCPPWTDIRQQGGFVSFMQAVLALWPSWVPHTEFHLRDYLRVVGPWLHDFTMKVWNLFTSLHGALTVPLVHNAVPRHPEQGKYGVVVFSHGMGCHRNTYSKICYDLASQGVIVAAVEHRDGSAGSSFYSLDGHIHEVPHKVVPSRDTEYSVRTSQLNHRVSEISRVLDVLEDLNSGKHVTNVAVMEGAAGKDDTVSLDSRPLIEQDSSVDLTWWEGKLDMSRVVVSGHSYGGNSALRAAVKDDRIGFAAVLDPWMFPGHQDSLHLTKPTSVIHTESFIHKNNIQVLKALLKDNDDVSACVLKGAVHLSQTDLPMLFEPLLFGKDLVRTVLGMKATVEPSQVLGENHKLLWGFIDDKINAKSKPTSQNLLDWGEELADK